MQYSCRNEVSNVSLIRVEDVILQINIKEAGIVRNTRPVDSDHALNYE